jgi:hypothetical protein
MAIEPGGKYAITKNSGREGHGKSEDKGATEIIIGEQCRGPIGTVRMAFLGQFTNDGTPSDKCGIGAKRDPCHSRLRGMD